MLVLVFFLGGVVGGQRVLVIVVSHDWTSLTNVVPGR